MKDVLKFEMLVLIEKNKPTNEKKLNLEIEKQFSKNPQLRDIKPLHCFCNNNRCKIENEFYETLRDD